MKSRKTSEKNGMGLNYQFSKLSKRISIQSMEMK
jgi:hypothetical protein